ncbi:MAG: hypothetical protein ACOX0B_03820 [Minisyncoccales bacterium]|jgi:hypothetical protein
MPLGVRVQIPPSAPLKFLFKYVYMKKVIIMCNKCTIVPFRASYAITFKGKKESRELEKSIKEGLKKGTKVKI